MKNWMPLVCCVCLLIGGSLLQVNGGATIEVPVYGVIMPPADAGHSLPMPLQPDTDGAAAPVGQLAALKSPASPGGCVNGLCPYVPRKGTLAPKSVTPKETTTVAGERERVKPARAAARVGAVAARVAATPVKLVAKAKPVRGILRLLCRRR